MLNAHHQGEVPLEPRLAFGAIPNHFGEIEEERLIEDDCHAVSAPLGRHGLYDKRKLSTSLQKALLEMRIGTMP